MSLLYKMFRYRDIVFIFSSTPHEYSYQFQDLYFFPQILSSDLILDNAVSEYILWHSAFMFNSSLVS